METNKNTLFTYEVLKSFQKNNIPIDGISIGEVTFKILLLLKSSSIYLLGIDLAFNQTTGQSHVETHPNNSTELFEKHNFDEQKTQQTYSLKKDTIFVKGNNHEKVITTRLFYVSLINYNRTVKQFKQKNQNIYNLSDDGVFIESTIPTNFSDLKLNYQDINKQQLHQNLIKFLTEKSIKKLNKYDLHNLHFEINQLCHISEEIKRFKNETIDSYDEFKRKVLNIGDNIFTITSHSTFLPEIFFNFYLIINRYLDYIFNDQILIEKDIKIKKVHKIWCEDLLTIIKKYKKYLKKM